MIPMISPNRCARTIVALVLAWRLCAPGAAQAQDERQAALVEDSVRARDLAMAAQIYHAEHGSLPPGLGAMAPYLGSTDDEVAARLVSSRAGPPPARRGELAAWLSDHASFRYLGLADVSLEDVSDWDRTVIGHLRLELAHEGEAGPGVPVAFLDGHVEVLPPETAAALIEESRQVFVALATGGRLPDSRQALWNLQRIADGLAAYARAHGGRLPPDLAEAFPYVPAGKGASTPQERARIFLSPKAARTTAIPAEPTVEWVRQRCAWQYLGGSAAGLEEPGAPLALIEDSQATILAHGRLADAAPRPGDPRDLVPIATAAGAVELIERDFAAWRLEQSRKVIEFARTGGASPLPDVQHAMRDLRLLSRALQRYAQSSEGVPPAGLSDLYDLVEDPEMNLSPVQRAQVFLTPTAERLAPPPETGIPEWLAERANYILVHPGDGKPDFRSHPAPVLLHQPLDEPLTMRTEGGAVEVIIAVDAAGRILTLPVEAAEHWIRAGR